MCQLLAQLKIGFFSSFFAAAVYSTNEANKAGLKQSIFVDVYGTIFRISSSSMSENGYLPKPVPFLLMGCKFSKIHQYHLISSHSVKK
jgi:hypothetical protein